MPVQRVPAEFCGSLFGIYDVPSDSGSGSYVVEISGTSGMTCTCKAYQFSAPGSRPWDRECKHTQRVWDAICKWNPQWCEGDPEPAMRPRAYTDRRFTGGECPACKGPLVPVMIAV